MHRLTLFLLTALTTATLSAQDLHVYYDAYADSVYFMEDSQRVQRPAVRKGHNVLLHINNYNNYLYDVSVSTEIGQIPIAQGSGLDFGKLGGSSSFNPGDLLLGNGQAGGMGVDEITGSGVGEKSGAGDTPAERERKERLAEMRRLESKINKANEKMSDLEGEMAELHGKMQLALEAQQIQSFVADELLRLRYNPQLAPAQIRQLANEYMTRIFGEADPSKLTLSDVLKKTDAGGELKGYKQTYDDKLGAYAARADSLKSALAALQDPKFDFPECNIEKFRAAAEKRLTQAEANLAVYRGNAARIATQMDQVKSLDVETLVQLRTTYLTIQQNDFSKMYRHTAAGDKMSMQLVFTPIDSMKIAGVATKHVSPLEISVFGGLEINASLGLNFGQFFKRPLNYFVRDSLVYSDNKDVFTPFLTSSVHFYRQGRGGASFGGSFGVGIPLGGTSSLESIAFFLGPSVVLGRGERVVFSAGLMGGKVDQLADGYAVGDRFEADPGLLKTVSRYELGYYVGLSFNLLRDK